MAVISKYVKMDENQINIEMKRDETHSTIAMNIVLPDLKSLKPHAIKAVEEIVV
jgi:septum formation topological specificity factor MinE